MPGMKVLGERLAPQGLVVLNVSLDRKRSDAEDFIRSFDLRDPVYQDESGPHNAMAERFLVIAAPHGVLIDRRGNLRYLSASPGQPETIKRMEALLAEKQF